MLTGTWHGVYRYDLEDHPGEEPMPVTFAISLTETDDGRLLGRVQDSPEDGGAPESGRIDGERNDSDVWFCKTMPVAYVSYEDGLVDLATWLRVEFEHQVDAADLPPAAISYSGTLDPDRRTIRGIWQILEQEIEVPGEGRIGLGHGSGTFTMHKVSDATSDVSRAFGDEPRQPKTPSVPLKSSTERMRDPSNLRVELSGCRKIDPCPCCAGIREVRSGHVRFEGHRVASFLVSTTRSMHHDTEVDLIFGEGSGDPTDESRFAISLVEGETDGIRSLRFVDANRRPIATSARIGHAATPEELDGTLAEAHALALWRAIRGAL